MIRQPPTSTLFPYTTLFRSANAETARPRHTPYGLRASALSQRWRDRSAHTCPVGSSCSSNSDPGGLAPVGAVTLTIVYRTRYEEAESRLCVMTLNDLAVRVDEARPLTRGRASSCCVASWLCELVAALRLGLAPRWPSIGQGARDGLGRDGRPEGEPAVVCRRVCGSVTARRSTRRCARRGRGRSTRGRRGGGLPPRRRGCGVGSRRT